MMPHNSRLRGPPSSSPASYAADLLGQLQSDLVFVTRMSAVGEVGAAMAHQLNDPLTALLLYLHEIKESGEHLTASEPARTRVQDLVDMALRETERACDIVQGISHAVERPNGAETIGVRASMSVEPWMYDANSKAASSVSPYSVQSRLTPREHEVLNLITGGDSNKQGGYRLGISTRTFEVHRAHIMAKLGAKNAADLVRMVLTESQEG